MKKIAAYTLVLGVLIALFGGCSQKIEPKPLTYTQLLTGETKKGWLFTSIIVYDNGKPSPTFNARDIIDPCFADDQYVFYANEEKKFEISEGNSRCDPRDPDVYFTDSWTLINANAQLEFLFPVLAGQVLPYVVKTLTANTLVVELYEQNLGSPYKISYRITFTSSGK